MAKLFDIAEGWTDRLGPFYVDAKLPGQTAFTPFHTATGKPLSDFDVKFGWRLGAGEWEEAPGEVQLATEDDEIADWESAYYYVPDDETDFVVAEGLLEQRYQARAVVSDDTGKDLMAPNGAAVEIVVHRK